MWQGFSPGSPGSWLSGTPLNPTLGQPCRIRPPSVGTLPSLSTPAVCPVATRTLSGCTARLQGRDGGRRLLAQKRRGHSQGGETSLGPPPPHVPLPQWVTPVPSPVPPLQSVPPCTLPPTELVLPSCSVPQRTPHLLQSGPARPRPSLHSPPPGHAPGTLPALPRALTIARSQCGAGSGAGCGAGRGTAPPHRR